MEELLNQLYRFLIQSARRMWPEISRVFLVHGTPNKLDSLSPDVDVSRLSKQVPVARYESQYLPERAVLIGIDALRVTDKGQGKQSSTVAWMLYATDSGVRSSRAATILISKNAGLFLCRLAGTDWEPDMSSVLFKNKARRICLLPNDCHAFSLQKDRVLSAVVKHGSVFLGTYDRRTHKYHEKKVVRDEELDPEGRTVCSFSMAGSYLLVSQLGTPPVRRIIDVRNGMAKTLSMPPECRNESPVWVDDKTWVEVTEKPYNNYSLWLVRHPFTKVGTHIGGMYRGTYAPSPLVFSRKMNSLIFMISPIYDENPVRFLIVPLAPPTKVTRFLSLSPPGGFIEADIVAGIGGKEYVWYFVERERVITDKRNNFCNVSLWRSSLDQGSFRRVASAVVPVVGVTDAKTIGCSSDYDGTPVVIYRSSVWRVN